VILRERGRRTFEPGLLGRGEGQFLRSELGANPGDRLMIGSGNLELVTERSDHRFELCDGLLSGLELVTHRASAAMRHLGPSP